MPFEFSGTSPLAFGAAGVPDPSLDDITPTSGPFGSGNSASTFSFGAGSSSMTPASFGTTVSLGAAPTFGASSSFGTPPSFGKSVSFGKPASPWSMPKGTPQPTFVAGPVPVADSKDKSVSGGGTLSKALSRATSKKPAIFGAIERGADAVLREFDDHLLDVMSIKGLPGLSEELESLAQRYPQTAVFVNFLFEKSAKLQGDRPLCAPNKEVALALPDDKEKEDSMMRSTLQPLIHAKLVETGLGKHETSSEGYLKDGQSRVFCQVALESTTHEAFMYGLTEEYAGDDEVRLASTGFAEWLWNEVCSLRSAVREDLQKAREKTDMDGAGGQALAKEATKPKAMLTDSILGQEPEANLLSAFLGRAGDEGRLAAKLKTGSNAVPVWSGNDYNISTEHRRCCEKPARTAAKKKRKVPAADRHKPLTEDERKLLQAWTVKRLTDLPREDADEEVLAEFVTALVKSDEDEATAKAACNEALREFLTSGTKAFIDELFEVIATRAYDPSSTTATTITETTTLELACAPARSGTQDTPFRFMDLPPELRTWVYRAALVPGTVGLQSCKHGNPLGVSPTLTMGLLATCRQINNEAKDLIYENTFIADSWPAGKLMIKEKLIPHHVLPRLRSLTLIIAIQPNYDWRQMKAMTGLKGIRICGDEGERVQDAARRHVVQGVLESVPATCVVAFGPQSKMETAQFNRTLNDHNPSRKASNPSELERLAGEIGTEAVKGCESGKSGLFYFDSAGALRHI